MADNVGQPLPEGQAAHPEWAGTNVREQAIPAAFQALVKAACSELPEGYRRLHLRVATMCSGTDAPIFALREIETAAFSQGQGNLFSFEHVFSVEIEAFKQAFIRRNAKPTGPIFTDVHDVALNDEPYEYPRSSFFGPPMFADMFLV
jgi:hypothetical protein